MLSLIGSGADEGCPSYYFQARLIRRRQSLENAVGLARVVRQNHPRPSNNSSSLSVNGGCHWLYYVLDFSNDYYIPLIILLGLVGNSLSGFVFLSSQLRVRSSSYYLAALALADFGFCSSLLLVWLNNNVGWRVFNKAGWCEGVVYVSSVCSSLSVWLIVGFTVERFIAIQYPLHRPRVCTISRAKSIIFVLSLLALASHSYCFFTAGLVHMGDGHDESELICDMKAEYLETMRIVNLVDFFASLIGPLVLIVTMNTCIWRNLLRFGRLFEQHSDATSKIVTISASVNNKSSSKRHSKIGKSDSNGSNNGGNSIALSTITSVFKTDAAAASSSNQSIFQFSPNNSRSHRLRSQSTQQTPLGSSRNVYQSSDVTSQCIHVGSSRSLTRNQQNITKMLLLISTVFITLNLPSYVIRICVFFFSLAGKNMPILLACSQQFFMLLYYTNFSINFLLYAMCGATFRDCLRQLLCRVLARIKKYSCFSK